MESMLEMPLCGMNSCGEYSRGVQTCKSTCSIHQKSCKSEKLAKQHYNNKENEGNRKTLLSITVEIEDGCSGHIQMKEGDSAEGVATRFCRDYSLPDDFVAPLTEHILNNIINISKKDNNIVFCSMEEREAYEEARINQGTPGSNYPDENDSYDYEKRSTTAECGGQNINQGTESASPCPNGSSGKGVQWLTPRTIMKTKLRTMLAQRLLCPTHPSSRWPTHSSSCRTYTSRCPTHSSRSKAVRTENIKRRKRRMSQVAKAGCLRLYCDFMDRKAKHLEMWRRSEKKYAEKIDRSKFRGPKKSRRMYRIRSQIAKRYRNYGELLYTEGLLMKEKLLKQMERKKRDDAEREMIGFTGKPRISERAKHIQRTGDVWDKLASEKFSCEHIRTKVMESQMAECTFMPQINPSSNSAEEPTKGSNISRFDLLFFDSENRRRRQKQYADWYPEGLTFQPVTLRRRKAAEQEEPQVSVFDRLTHLEPQKPQEKKTAPVDKATGRELFKPQTGRRPQTARNPQKLPIGHFLYEMQGARQCKREAIAAKEEKTAKSLSKCSYVTSQSWTYLKKLKLRAFKQMFGALDSDKDGFIKLNEVDANRVSSDAAQDIKTLIKMGKGDESLNFDAFHKLMHEVEEKYHKGTTVRGNLRHVPHIDNGNLTFEPKICAMSNDLAGKRRPNSTCDQWYNTILQDAEKRQQKVEALRKERQKIEMKECTFVPELITKASQRSKGGHCRLSRGAPPPPTSEKGANDVPDLYLPNDRDCGCKEADGPATDEANKEAPGTSNNEADDRANGGADDGANDRANDNSGSEFDGVPRRRLPLEEIGGNSIETKEPTDEASCLRPKTTLGSPFVDPRW